MRIRKAGVAGMFYPRDRATCLDQIAACTRPLHGQTLPSPLYGGVVPHAGWTYSGATAGQVYAALAAEARPDAIVLFGAVHSWAVRAASAYGEGAWQTPLGELVVDHELGQATVDVSDGLVVIDPGAHDGEHSIEVQLPFLRHLFGVVPILPIAVPPFEGAHQVGIAVARAAGELDRSILAVGSSDLTHYGPRYGHAPVGTGEQALRWTHDNDARILDLLVEMRADAMVGEAAVQRNACGGGALAATVACVAALGATRGITLHYTTSHEVLPMGRPSDMVGYGAVVFA